MKRYEEDARKFFYKDDEEVNEDWQYFNDSIEYDDLRELFNENPDQRDQLERLVNRF